LNPDISGFNNNSRNDDSFVEKLGKDLKRRNDNKNEESMQEILVGMDAGYRGNNNEFGMMSPSRIGHGQQQHHMDLEGQISPIIEHPKQGN